MSKKINFDRKAFFWTLIGFNLGMMLMLLMIGQFLVEINWVILGWLIDMVLNGFVWLIIAALSLVLLDMTDKWTRKAVEWIGKADKWTREFTEKFIDNSFEWIQKKNLKIISSIVFLIIFGTLAQLGIIPKLIN